MRKLGIGLPVLILGSLLTSTPWAFQSNSFTYQSTAGMFEDEYDYFVYSPAYLPGFQRRALWSQFSNLRDSNEQVFSGSGSSYYLLGGQAEVGPGRAGVMLDWYSRTTPLNATDYNGRNWAGFGESTVVTLQDTDFDGILDYKRESYGKIGKQNNDSEFNVYAAYGLGGMFGFDLGAALRVNLISSNPNYDSLTGNSFEEEVRVRHYDVLAQETLYVLDRDGTGSFNYGESFYNLVLAARSQKLIPNLDLIVTAAPVLVVNSNTFEYTRDEFEDFTPQDPANISEISSHLSTTGLNTSQDLPGSGLGVVAMARGDYKLSDNLLLTGRLELATYGVGVEDGAKKDSLMQDNDRTILPQQTQREVHVLETFADSTSGDTLGNARLRLQYLAQGWKLGVGINASMQTFGNEIHVNQSISDITTVTGTGNPATDLTTAITAGYQGVTKTTTTSNTLALPVGFVIDVVKNLPIRFGVEHAIIANVTSTEFEVTSKAPITTVVTDGNNTVVQSVRDVNNELQARHESTQSVTHQTHYFYGATWWPAPDLQIDLAGFSNLLNLSQYKLSVTFYF